MNDKKKKNRKNGSTKQLSFELAFSKILLDLFIYTFSFFFSLHVSFRDHTSIVIEEINLKIEKITHKQEQVNQNFRLPKGRHRDLILRSAQDHHQFYLNELLKIALQIVVRIYL